MKKVFISTYFGSLSMNKKQISKIGKILILFSKDMSKSDHNSQLLSK